MIKTIITIIFKIKLAAVGLLTKIIRNKNIELIKILYLQNIL